MFHPGRPFYAQSIRQAILLALTALPAAFAAQWSAVLPFESDIRATAPAVGFPPTPYTINEIIGAERFYAEGFTGLGVVVANAEAGHIWAGTDPSAAPGSYEAGHSFLRGQVARYVGAPDFSPGYPVEYDYHATMVGHALAGAGPLTGSSLGIAPFSTLWSGAIATSFGNPGDPRPSGAFTLTDASFHQVYQDFFYGTNPGGRRADVVNSSWGGGDDADGSGILARATDGLAFANPLTTFVVSAGNRGPEANSVTDIAAAYNNISVGALTGPWSAHPFRQAAEFSSRGPSDFYNPVTQETVKGVRATVDIVAPGEDLRLAAYLYATGGNSDRIGSSNPFLPVPEPADAFSFIFASGTSFSAPLVAGGVGLLKEVAYTRYGGAEEALDSRVMKSVLQASADHNLLGWNNGQYTDGSGVVRTEQALDYTYGAGRLDLNQAFETFAGHDITADVLGLTDDGKIAPRGWDYGGLSYDDPANIYYFDRDLSGQLSVALNWFVERTYGYQDLTEEITSEDLSFANLNLELWTVDATGQLDTLYAISESLYNNTEHLYVLLDSGRYALRILLEGFVYGQADFVTFGLAWAVPESSTPAAGIVLGVIVLSCCRARRFRRSRGTGRDSSSSSR